MPIVQKVIDANGNHILPPKHIHSGEINIVGLTMLDELKVQAVTTYDKYKDLGKVELRYSGKSIQKMLIDAGKAVILKFMHEGKQAKIIWSKETLGNQFLTSA